MVKPTKLPPATGHLPNKPGRFTVRFDPNTRPAPDGYRLAPCPGSAHSPDVGGMVDYCGLCAPRWGWLERLSPEAIREIATRKRRGGAASARELARVVRDVLDALDVYAKREGDTVQFLRELHSAFGDYMDPAK